MSMTITCPVFSDQTGIPTRYTGDGADVSPPLTWQGAPKETKEFAIVCDDPDAPSQQPWVHWLIYKIPADVHQLPENLPTGSRLESPVTAYQGRNSWSSGQSIGYRGPAPPPGHGRHHYHFKLYAVDQELDLEPGIAKAELMAALKGHVLSEAEIVYTYER